VDCAPVDVIHRGHARPPGELHVTEAMIREAWLPLLHAQALQRVAVGLERTTFDECTGDATSTSARWDCIFPIPQAEGSSLGVLTASARGGPAGANGVAGVVSRPDGVHWKAEPPATEPPATEPCGFGWLEVGCHVSFGSRHYLLVGGSGGGRADPVYNTGGKAGGMMAMMPRDARGPY